MKKINTVRFKKDIQSVGSVVVNISDKNYVLLNMMVSTLYLTMIKLIIKEEHFATLEMPASK